MARPALWWRAGRRGRAAAAGPGHSLCAGLLYASLEREIRPGEAVPATTAVPGAIIILAGEAAWSRDAPASAR
ncbi:hypothetical protein ACFQU2_27575 [Siccirubricoccus deserti]